MVCGCVILLTQFCFIANAQVEENEDEVLYVIGDEEEESYEEIDQDVDLVNVGLHAGDSTSDHTDNEIGGGETMELRVQTGRPGESTQVDAVYSLDTGEAHYIENEHD